MSSQCIQEIEGSSLWLPPSPFRPHFHGLSTLSLSLVLFLVSDHEPLLPLKPLQQYRWPCQLAGPAAAPMSTAPSWWSDQWCQCPLDEGIWLLAQNEPSANLFTQCITLCGRIRWSGRSEYRVNRVDQSPHMTRIVLRQGIVLLHISTETRLWIL